MKFSDFFSCCLSEESSPKNNVFLVFTEKSLTHNQKCIIDEKTPSSTVCDSISKTEQFLKTKFGHSTKNYCLLPGIGKMSLLLLCRENYTRFSTRILNFFEIPLTLKRMKPERSEYVFLVMRESEIRAFQEVKKGPKYDVSQFANIMEKGRLYKKNGVGDFKEKYFVLTKKLLLFLDLVHKKKKMHILELEKVEFGYRVLEKDCEIFELTTPKKVYYLKAESKGVFNYWKEKIHLQIDLVKRNLCFSELDKKIADNEREFYDKISGIVLHSFEGIENVLKYNFLREWFFQFISSMSPEESGLLLLLEFYIKFNLELEGHNYKEAFKNINRIYEILRKVSEDWEKKPLSPIKNEPEESKPLVKRPTKTNIIINFNNPEEKAQKTMYHTRNNTPCMEHKTPCKIITKIPMKSNNNFLMKKPVKNLFNVKVEFCELNPQKSKEIKPKHLTKKKNFEEPLCKIEESVEQELIFHDEFFLKIFNDFDWKQCEKKFFFMKEVFLLEGIESQIIDIFADLFVHLVKYFETNYYFSFIESHFYLKKLVFSQNERLKKENGFQKPTFLSKRQLPKGHLSKARTSKKTLHFNENQENNNERGILKKKKVVTALQLQDIRNFKYGNENPYSMFQEPERESMTLETTFRRKFTVNKSEEIANEEKNEDE